jgi:hypothetical protein
MRTRNTEAMGWGVRVAIGVTVLVLVGAVGLSVYGGRVKPVQHPVEQAISDDRLPK